MCCRRVLLSPLLLVMAQAAQAECHIPTFVRSTAIGEPAILSAPSPDAAVLGSMPMVEDPERGPMGAEALIVEIRDGYADLRRVVAWSDPDRTAPDGWVDAAELGFVVQTEKGFAQPDPSSEVVWQGQDWIYTDMIDTLLACEGEWVALQMVDAKTPDPVWVRGVCNGQETTCDGVQGD